ncbi:aspartate kinase [Hyphomicrobiales bacterium]|jgi:aspartate kinase|nr:aspartate kinase [Hyphomicrobiales bacterium]
MKTIVMKFGGTSLANIDRMRQAAGHIEREFNKGLRVIVIVSAMAGETDRLVNLANKIEGNLDLSERDVLISSGEQASAALLAMILKAKGIEAKSWLGWQLPIKTDYMHGSARILNIDKNDLEDNFNKHEISIVAGFQGISDKNRITTLGRGGSDTSAIAIACAIEADICDIYTDVDGVYTADPRIVPKAQRLEKVSYEEMLEMASLGAKVLQTRSVELGMTSGLSIRVRSTFDDHVIDDNINNQKSIGTIICEEDEILEHKIVSGIAYSKDEAKITLTKLNDNPGIAALVFGSLADGGINVDMIVQNISSDGKFTDLTFTVPASDIKRATVMLESLKNSIQYDKLLGSKDIVKVSVIGVGMRSHSGVAALMFKTLAEKGINILAIATSEIKVSVLIDVQHLEIAVKSLHTAYNLDKNS